MCTHLVHEAISCSKFLTKDGFICSSLHSLTLPRLFEQANVSDVGSALFSDCNLKFHSNLRLAGSANKCWRHEGARSKVAGKSPLLHQLKLILLKEFNKSCKDRVWQCDSLCPLHLKRVRQPTHEEESFHSPHRLLFVAIFGKYLPIASIECLHEHNANVFNCSAGRILPAIRDSQKLYISGWLAQSHEPAWPQAEAH